MLEKTRRPLMVMAAVTAALALVGGGTATARSLITSGDIKNNSIKSVDVRNGGLHYRDLSSSTRTKLRGARGPAGPGAGAVTAYTTPGEWVDLDGDLVGDALFAGVTCPSGTKLTGGGGENYTDFATTIDTADGANGWLVASFADPSNALDDVVATAMCMSSASTSFSAGHATKVSAQVKATYVTKLKAAYRQTH